MSLFSDLLYPFRKVEDAVAAIVPASLISQYGSYAHTIAANIVHDAEVAVKAGAAVAMPMSKTLIASVITAVEQEAAALAPQILSGKLTFSAAIATAATNLKSEAVTSLVPALKIVGETTLKTIVSTATSTAIASVANSPTLPSAPVQAASSGA